MNQQVAHVDHVVQAGAKKSSVAASANIKISQKLMPIGIQTGSSGYP